MKSWEPATNGIGAEEIFYLNSRYYLCIMKTSLRFLGLLLLSFLFVGSAFSQILSTTEDGRKALLFSDGHWEWMDEYVLGQGKETSEPQTAENPYETSIDGDRLIIKKGGVIIDEVELVDADFEGGRSYNIRVASAPYLFDAEEDEVYYLQDGKQVIGSATKPDQARDLAIGHYINHVYRGVRSEVDGKEVVIVFEGQEAGRIPILGPEFETSGKYTVNVGEAPYLYDTETNKVKFMGIENTGYAVSKEQAVDVAVHDFVQRIYKGFYGKLSKDKIEIFDNGILIKTVSVQKPKFEGARNFSIKIGDSPYVYNDDGDEVKYLGGQVIGKAVSKEMALRVCAWHYLETMAK